MRYESYIGSQFHTWTEGTYTEAQIDVLSDLESSFILLSGSYRSGKTLLVSRMAIRHALTFENSRVMIVRQHLASLKKSTLLTFLGMLHWDWIENWSNSDLVCRFKNGSTVTFLGCSDPQRLGSVEASLAIIDEASEVSFESFSMIQGRLSLKLSLPDNIDELIPELQTYARAIVDKNRVILSCNPYSPSHWLYKSFIGKPKPGHKCYRSNSISNTNLPKEYLINNLSAYVRNGEKYDIDYLKQAIEDIRAGRKSSDGMFLRPALNTQGQRGLLGLWTANDGLVFDLDERDHVLDVEKYAEITKDKPKQVYGGVDFGFQNPRIVIIEYYPDIDTYICVKYWGLTKQTPEVMLEQMEAWYHEYDMECFFLPHDRPDLAKKAKQMIGARGIKKAKNSVLAGINSISARFAHRKLLFLDDGTEEFKKAWDETSGYEWACGKDGQTKDQVVKERDHAPDAIRYAIHTLDRKRRRNRPDPSDSFELYPVGG